MPWRGNQLHHYLLHAYTISLNRQRGGSGSAAIQSPDPAATPDGFDCIVEELLERNCFRRWLNMLALIFRRNRQIRSEQTWRMCRINFRAAFPVIGQLPEDTHRPISENC